MTKKVVLHNCPPYSTWRRINTTLRKLERRQRGRNEDPSAGAIDKVGERFYFR